MRKLICLIICLGILTLGSTAIAGAASDAQGWRNLKGLWNVLENNRKENAAQERQEEQDRIQREYLEQRQKEIEQQKERNRIEAERLEQEKRETDLRRQTEYEKDYWKEAQQQIVVQQQEVQQPEVVEEIKTSTVDTPKRSILLSAKVGKIGDSEILYDIPNGLLWNPNPCIIKSYESTPCDSCSSGYDSKISLQNKAVRDQCWKENPQHGPMGEDKNYKIRSQ